MFCESCKEKCVASSFLLSEPTTWCGTYYGKCHACTEGMTESAFKRAVRKAWRSRAKYMGKCLSRAREYTWAKLEAELAEEYPGAGKQELRDAIKAKLRAIAAQWAASMTADAARKAAAAAVHEKYLETLSVIAREPVRSTLGGGWTLRQEACQYLTHLCEGVSIFWLCRKADCLMFCNNALWMKSRSSGHYRCPCCEALYRPFTGDGDRVGAQKVIGVKNGDNFQFVPCAWPSSEADGWLNGQLEAHARVAVRGESVDSFLSRSAVQLADLLRPYESVPYGSRFVQHRFREPRTIYSAQWDWSHLSGRTIEVARLTPQEAAEPPFAEWDRLIALLGRIISCGAAVLDGA